MPKVVIAAAGSGGHLVPAQQLADKLMQKEFSVCFAASGLAKNKHFDPKKFAFQEISSGPLKKVHLLFKGFFQAWRFLKKYQPDLIVGFGSYHTFPVMLAALFLRKKLVLFEANTLLGRVNRFFVKKAELLALQFPLFEEVSGVKKIALTPLLPWSTKFQLLDQVSARESLGLDPKQPTLLVFGGSQGAQFLNNLVLELVSLLGTQTAKVKWQLILLTGSALESKKVKAALEKFSCSVCVLDYSREMAKLFSAADLVLCRAGATTLAELVFAKRPALLVPFPLAKDNHQEVNARFFQDQIQGGYWLKQSEAKTAMVLKTLNELWLKREFFQTQLARKEKEIAQEKRISLDELIQKLVAL